MNVPYSLYLSVIRDGRMKETEFDSLSQAAEDVLFAAVGRKLPETEPVQRAICYEAEMLSVHGGRNAVGGYCALNGLSETLGDAQVGTRNRAGAFEKVPSLCGTPVSPVALGILRNAGYASRAVCADRGGETR